MTIAQITSDVNTYDVVAVLGDLYSNGVSIFSNFGSELQNSDMNLETKKAVFHAAFQDIRVEKLPILQQIALDKNNIYSSYNNTRIEANDIRDQIIVTKEAIRNFPHHSGHTAENLIKPSAWYTKIPFC